MDAVARVDGLLRDIGARLGLRLSLDEDGQCGLECASGLVCTVTVPESTDLLVFAASLASAADIGDRSAALGRCMRLNLHGAGTDGCTLGLDAEADEIVLSSTWPLAMVGSDDFGLLLGNFIRTAERLAADIALPVPESRMDATERPPSPADMLMHLQFRA